jgi:glycosyltransferase involved in cell wall biosynthesis
MVKVSVIMPVYNAEDFLRDSVDSVLNQTLDDIELFCVDDGSNDSSLEILNEYSENDKRVTVFALDHQGAGNARNYAMEYASGEYLYFMDADDFLDLNAFEDFCSVCESKNLDFVLFKLINYDVDRDEYYESEYYNMSKILNKVKDDVFSYRDLGHLIFKMNSSTCSKFYNREFIVRTGAKFRENSKFNDNQFFWGMIFCAERIYFLDEFYYTRTRHSKSLTGSNDRNHSDIIGVYNDITELFIKHNQLEKFKKKLYNQKVFLSYRRFSEVRDEDKPYFYNVMKEDFSKMPSHERYDEFLDVVSKENRRRFDDVINSKDYDDFKRLFDAHEFKLNPKAQKKPSDDGFSVKLKKRFKRFLK